MGYERPVVASSLSDEASGTSSRSKRSCLPTENIVVFAPIASASDETAMIVNPRLLRSIRAANTRSDPIPSMERDFTRKCVELSGGEHRQAQASGSHLLTRLHGA